MNTLTIIAILIITIIALYIIYKLYNILIPSNFGDNNLWEFIWKPWIIALFIGITCISCIKIIEKEKPVIKKVNKIKKVKARSMPIDRYKPTETIH